LAFKLGEHSCVFFLVALKEAKLFFIVGMSVKIKVQLPDDEAKSHNAVKTVICAVHLQHPIRKGLSRQGKAVPRESALSQE